MTKAPSKLKPPIVFSDRFSIPQDDIKISVDSDEDDYPELEVIEVPVVKRMVFQFKKPVRLEFS